MKKIAFVCIFFLIITNLIFSLDWPTESKDFLLFFGQENKPHKGFSNGVIFKNVDTVRASEHGTHLISIGQEKQGSRFFPSTLGNVEIIIHNDGLQTVYGNLQEIPLFDSRNKTESGVIIGRSGNSAWCEKNALIFQVVDTKKQVFINPLILLPSIDDTIKPKIENITLVDSNGKEILLENDITIKQGNYNLYASIYDNVKNEERFLSPFRVTIWINGINKITVPFEVLKVINNETILKDTKISAYNFYKKIDKMCFGDLNLKNGKIELTISARDITGNESTKKFSFLVK